MNAITPRPSFRRLAAGFAGALLATSLAFGTGGVGAAGGAPSSPVSNPASVFAPGPAGHAWTGTGSDGSSLGTNGNSGATRPGLTPSLGGVPSTTDAPASRVHRSASPPAAGYPHHAPDPRARR
jgi:hypothetical protein